MQCQEAQQRFRLRITLCCRLATLIFCQVVTSTTQVSDSGLQLESTIAVTRCFCFSKCKSKGWKQPCCSMKALNHSPVDMFIQGIISIRIICKLCMKVCWAATGLGFCFSICWLRLFNFSECTMYRKHLTRQSPRFHAFGSLASRNVEKRHCVTWLKKKLYPAELEKRVQDYNFGLGFFSWTSSVMEWWMSLILSFILSNQASEAPLLASLHKTIPRGFTFKVPSQSQKSQKQKRWLDCCGCRYWIWSLVS